jgi:LacI family transcriptional regulator
MEKKTSLKDVARHVGVSTALVSYVLNNKEKEARVGKEMVVRIRNAARKLNYQPNLIAKSLKSGKTNSIGLVLADISNPFFSGIARSIEDQAKHFGYTVIFGSSDESRAKSADLIETFLNRQVDGLIIAPADHTQDQIELIRKTGTPIVLIDRYFPEINVNSVRVDNLEASHKAVSHLINNGYRRIGAFVYKNELQHTRQRMLGYTRALKDNDIAAKKEWLVEITYDNLEIETADAISRLFRPKQKVDALFFSTNSLAIAGLKQLNSLGIKVPNDVAVISFDESDAFDFFYSPITYVRQSIQEMAKQAVSILVDSIVNKTKKSILVEIPAQLVVRESCGTKAKKSSRL